MFLECFPTLTLPSNYIQNMTETQDLDVCVMVCPKIWTDYHTLIYTQHQEEMKSVGSHGNLSLLFMMKMRL
jgi:hypothetical protein